MGKSKLTLFSNPKAPKPLHEQVDDTVLPLINVVFLLLSFCLILSNFIPLDTKIKIPNLETQANNALSNADKHIIYVATDGELTYNNAVIQPNQLPQQRKYVVAVSRDLPAPKFLKIMGQLKSAKIKKVSIVIEAK